jgi:hypothetical protein
MIQEVPAFHAAAGAIPPTGVDLKTNKLASDKQTATV